MNGTDSPNGNFVVAPGTPNSSKINKWTQAVRSGISWIKSTANSLAVPLIKKRRDNE